MTAVVEITDLRKVYGRTVAVDGVSLQVREGEIFGILGPNGAGKTTTVECVAGLRRADSGRIRVLGLDPDLRHGPEFRALRESVGMQLQNSAVPAKLTVREVTAMYASFYRNPADPDALITALGLEAKRDTYFKRLSGGQKQRLSIALALIGNPRVAVLDELTTGLDPQARRETWTLIEGIRDRGVTVILVSHFMEEAEYLCDRVAMIDGGRVVAQGTSDEVIAQAGGGQRVRFRPSAAFDDTVLTALPQVATLERHGGAVSVTGSGDLVNAVIRALDDAGVTARDVRSESPTLEDAFLALTGHVAPDAAGGADEAASDAGKNARHRRGGKSGEARVFGQVGKAMRKSAGGAGNSKIAGAAGGSDGDGGSGGVGGAGVGGSGGRGNGGNGGNGGGGSGSTFADSAITTTQQQTTRTSERNDDDDH